MYAVEIYDAVRPLVFVEGLSGSKYPYARAFN
jgi:hypothetical protein